MKKILFVLCVLLLVPTLALANSDMVSVSELRQQVETMGRWTASYEAYKRKIEVDIPIDIPEVNAVPIVQVSGYYAVDQEERLTRDGTKLNKIGYDGFDIYEEDGLLMYLGTTCANGEIKAGMAVGCSTDKTSDKLLKNDSARTTFKDAIEEYDSIMQRKEGMVFSLTDGDRLALLKKKYSYIKDAYELLGMEQIRELKYHTSHIQRLLISISEKMDNNAKVAKLLLTIPAFRIGEFIPSADIKDCLNSIYGTLGIKGKASIKDFEDYAKFKEARKRIDGKQVRGYIIQYIKIK